MRPPKRRTKKHAAKGRGKGRIQERLEGPHLLLFSPQVMTKAKMRPSWPRKSHLYPRNYKKRVARLLSRGKTDYKKAKKSCRLTDKQEEAQVLEWVEEHPCLLNLKNKDVNNKVLKDRLWGDKATELGVGG